MKTHNLGFITIGQSPREDIVREIESNIQFPVHVYQRGALDRLSAKEIARYAPEHDDLPLITMLKSGESVVVGKEKIVPLVQRCIHLLEQEDEITISLLCTEPLPEFNAAGLVLQPWNLMGGAIRSSSLEGTIGVAIPIGEQKDHVRAKWANVFPHNIETSLINPYQEGEEIEGTFSSPQLACIVLDCMGYNNSLKERLRSFYNVPVFSPRLILASYIKNLVS